jgi:hypothetical protein
MCHCLRYPRGLCASPVLVHPHNVDIFHVTDHMALRVCVRSLGLVRSCLEGRAARYARPNYATLSLTSGQREAAEAPGPRLHEWPMQCGKTTAVRAPVCTCAV